MPDLSAVSKVTFDAALNRLNGGLLVAVRYFYLDALGGWDLGNHHEPTMGVELVLDQAVVLLTWGDAFGRFGLELIEAPGGTILRNSPQVVDVSRHEWWSRLVGSRLVAADVWAEGLVDSDWPQSVSEKAPLAVSISNGSDEPVWVVAAKSEHDAAIWFGADEVLVTRDGGWLTRAAPQHVRFT